MKLPKVNLVHGKDVDYLLFDSVDYISKCIKLSGEYEPEVRKLAEGILNDISNGTVLDIGANLGSFTVPLAKKYGKLNFVSFEPQRTIYHQLCGNVFLNSLDNVTPKNLGVGSCDCEVHCGRPDYYTTDNIGSFGLGSVGNEIIQVVTLDSFGFDDVRLIKIDVEGFELEVLKGAQETITRNNFPPILFEVWTVDWFKEKRETILNYVENLGYTLHIYGENVLAKRQIS